MFNKTTIANLQHDLLAAFEPVGRKYGVKMALKPCALFSETLAPMKLEIFVPGTAGAETPEEVRFEKFCTLFGLKPSDRGSVVTSNGCNYILTGMRAGKSASRFYAKRLTDGRVFLLSREQLAESIPMPPPQNHTVVDCNPNDLLYDHS